MRQNGIKHLKSAPYHPATNGQAESFVKMLKRALRRGEGASLQTMIDVFLLQYRNAVHPTTNDTPAIRLYGHALRSRLDLLRPGRSVAGAVSRPTLMRGFDVGQRVMVRDYRHDSKWVPAVVSVILGPANCLIRTDDGKVWKRHVDQMHDRCSASPPVPSDMEPPPLMSPGPGVASSRRDVPAPMGLADSVCLPDSVLPEGDEQACRPGALDVADGASPARVSPRPSQEASEPEPGPSGGAVRPGRIRRRPRYLQDFECD